MTARRRAYSKHGSAALRSIAAACVLCCAAAPLAARAGEGATAGSYCPLPKPGAKPQCLAPAEDAYREFFTALDGGELGEDAVKRLEADFSAGPDADPGYLALSTLAFGYYQLSRQAAASEGEDPVIVARLERWSALLANAYGARPEGDRYRDAVRTAALDIQQRAPSVTLACVDAEGETAPCGSAEAVLRGIDAVASRAGIGPALERVLERTFGTAAP